MQRAARGLTLLLGHCGRGSPLCDRWGEARGRGLQPSVPRTATLGWDRDVHTGRLVSEAGSHSRQPRLRCPGLPPAGPASPVPCLPGRPKLPFPALAFASPPSSKMTGARLSRAQVERPGGTHQGLEGRMACGEWWGYTGLAILAKHPSGPGGPDACPPRRGSLLGRKRAVAPAAHTLTSDVTPPTAVGALSHTLRFPSRPVPRSPPPSPAPLHTHPPAHRTRSPHTAALVLPEPALAPLWVSPPDSPAKRPPWLPPKPGETLLSRLHAPRGPQPGPLPRAGAQEPGQERRGAVGKALPHLVHPPASWNALTAAAQPNPSSAPWGQLSLWSRAAGGGWAALGRGHRLETPGGLTAPKAGQAW